jgi:exodeoxyribonuclease-5
VTILAAAAEFTLSASQQSAVDRIAEWLKSAPPVRYCTDPVCLGLDPDADEAPHTHGAGQEYPVLSLGGLAGTGKSMLAASLAGLLGKRITFATPTNKAAWVLRRNLDELQRARCGTYHSLLYRPKGWHTCLRSGETAQEQQCACGRGFEADECECPRFRCGACRLDAAAAGPEPAPGCRVESHLEFEPRLFAGGHRDLLVLDEASMVTEEQVQDIRRFGLPVLLVGDHGQLPPVKGALSPWMLSPEIVLEENFRQAEASGIVPMALHARSIGMTPIGRYGAGAVVMSGSARPDAYHALAPDRLVPGPDSLIITWTNSKRADINKLVHAAHTQSQAPIAGGDRVTALGTYECDVMKRRDGRWHAAGWQERVFNGIVGTVAEVTSQGRKTADVIIELDGAEPGAGVKVMKRIDLGQLGAGRVLRPDERSGAAFDYGYCFTAHKAQGSQANDVAVVGAGPGGPDRARWLYTAITRAKRRCLVIL